MQSTPEGGYTGGGGGVGGEASVLEEVHRKPFVPSDHSPL